MVSKFKFIKPGLWSYGIIEIKRIITGGYWIYDRYNRDIYVPRIIYWRISRNSIKLRSTLTFQFARKIVKKFSQ